MAAFRKTYKSSLQGMLKDLGLADLFTVFATARKTGTLKLFDDYATKHVYFEKGQVKKVSSYPEHREKLGDLLIRKGRILQADLDQAIRRQKETGELLGKILVDMGKAGAAEIDELERFQLEEEIFDLFDWEKAGFEYFPDVTPEELYGERGSLRTHSVNTQRIILEAARRIDEWERIPDSLTKMETVFRIKREEAGRDLMNRQGLGGVMDLIDGKRTLGEITRLCPMGKLDICKLLHRLLEKGVIQEVTFSEGLSMEELEEEERRFQSLLREDKHKAGVQGRRLIRYYQGKDRPWDARRIVVALQSSDLDLEMQYCGILLDERD